MPRAARRSFALTMSPVTVAEISGESSASGVTTLWSI